MGNRAPAPAPIANNLSTPRCPAVTVAARNQVPEQNTQTCLDDISPGNLLLLATVYVSQTNMDVRPIRRLLSKGAPVDWICAEWTQEQLVGQTRFAPCLINFPLKCHKNNVNETVYT
jgi:hypothetical protein